MKMIEKAREKLEKAGYIREEVVGLSSIFKCNLTSSWFNVDYRGDGPGMNYIVRMYLAGDDERFTLGRYSTELQALRAAIRRLSRGF